MNKEEIKKILPHREPMLLVDEVELMDGKAFGKCHIRGDEYFLQGHFPGNPIVPGVIQCEMLAQSACVLLADGASEGMTPVFTSLDKVKFRGMVKPGDTLETECELVRQRGMFYFAKGTGRVNGKVCVSAEFSFALVKAQARRKGTGYVYETAYREPRRNRGAHYSCLQGNGHPHRGGVFQGGRGVYPRGAGR